MAPTSHMHLRQKLSKYSQSGYGNAQQANIKAKLRTPDIYRKQTNQSGVKPVIADLNARIQGLSKVSTN